MRQRQSTPRRSTSTLRLVARSSLVPSGFVKKACHCENAAAIFPETRISSQCGTHPTLLGARELLRVALLEVRPARIGRALELEPDLGRKDRHRPRQVVRLIGANPGAEFLLHVGFARRRALRRGRTRQRENFEDHDPLPRQCRRDAAPRINRTQQSFDKQAGRTC